MDTQLSRVLLFSERYKDILAEKDFATSFSFELCSALYYAIIDFDEPQTIQPNRYDNFTVTTTAGNEAYIKYFREMGFPLDRAHDVDLEWLYKRDYNEWFDIIELWDAELSSGEKAQFRESVNSVFFSSNQPWCLVQGRILKIDSKQFEQDLRQRTLSLLELNVHNVPLFQNALDEYIRAIEFFNKHEYKDCILYSEKSYESALKIVCSKTEGQADSLTRAFMQSDFINDLPQQLSKEGFRSNVLSTLPYLRNQLKVGHGEGGESISVNPALAKLTLNLSATLNSFLVEQYISHLSVEEEPQEDEEELPF